MIVLISIASSPTESKPLETSRISQMTEITKELIGSSYSAPREDNGENRRICLGHRMGTMHIVIDRFLFLRSVDVGNLLGNTVVDT